MTRIFQTYNAYFDRNKYAFDLTYNDSGIAQLFEKVCDEVAPASFDEDQLAKLEVAIENHLINLLNNDTNIKVLESKLRIAASMTVGLINKSNVFGKWSKRR